MHWPNLTYRQCRKKHVQNINSPETKPRFLEHSTQISLNMLKLELLRTFIPESCGPWWISSPSRSCSCCCAQRVDKTCIVYVSLAYIGHALIVLPPLHSVCNACVGMCRCCSDPLHQERKLLLMSNSSTN